MTSTRSVLSKLAPAAYAALRIAAGAMLLMHGLQKTFGLIGGPHVPLMSRLGAAGVIELVAGALIFIGLLTVPMAFLASGELAFAYFLAHAPQGFWPVQNGGERAVLYCFIFLYIATRGGGWLSLDTIRR